MKAIVIEIYKNYCIIMTEDGQFLKQKITAGFVEIGDEILVEEPAKPAAIYRKNLLKGFSIAFAAVVVITMSSILSYRYLRQYFPAADLQRAAQAEVSPGNTESEGAENKMLMETPETIFEKVYSLEKIDTTFKDKINDLFLFSYKITAGEDESRNLYIKIKNTNEQLVFNGKVDLEMQLSDGSISRTITLELKDFKPGSTAEEVILLESGESQFKLIIK